MNTRKELPDISRPQAMNNAIILVVDDEPKIRDALRTILSNTG
jgi:hypothetical protein